MIEVELKARLANPEGVEARVASFSRLVGPFDKFDAYWHGSDWRLQRGKKGFRVRSDGGKTCVTFKTKRCEGGVEINQEREFEVSDLDSFVELALRLGCEPFYKKRKTGRRYEVESPAGGLPITIEILEVEGLGPFIEIEALLADEEPSAVALAQGEIRGLLARAGVPPEAIESRYYSELLLAAGLIQPAT